jgi:hypothetical protein
MLDALHGVSFLTPLDGLFVLAAALPLGALFLTERRAARVRRLLTIVGHRRRAVVPVVAALVTLSALVAVAAAQPVFVREQLVSERADAQAFVLFDTSLSMRASAGPGKPSRLQRAKRMAIRLQQSLSDVPFGIASMTDRSLPNLMPTTDRALFDRTVRQSVAVDQPPPSQLYKGRATTFDALIPLVESHFYTEGVQRRLLIVYTDGESAKISPLFKLTLQQRLTPVFVHVWEPGERIYNKGKVDPHYVSDPTSMAALNDIARITGVPRAFPEGDTGAIVRAARAAVGRAGTRTHVAAYARIALAPWFVLGCIVPLAFLLWRRNA